MSMQAKMYTYQQEVGGQRYSHGTKIGNWLQDMELEEIKHTEYYKANANKAVSVNKAKDQIAPSLSKVPHSYSQDGKLQFGFKVLLKSKFTNGILALDLNQRIESYEEGYSVTTSKAPNLGACGRTIFVIEKCDDDTDIADLLAKKRGVPSNCVTYGQKIRLRANNYVSKKNLYLHSRAVSTTAYAAKSKFQQVCMFSLLNFDSVWQIEHINPNLRFQVRGTPVMVNEQVILKHTSTNQHLASDNLDIHNDYGRQCQVNCHSYQVKSKGQQLKNQTSGKVTHQVSQRVVGPENSWIFLTSSNPADAVELTPPQQMTIDDVILQIKQRIKQRGSNGIRGIARIFRAMDDNGNHLLDADDFRWGLLDYGIQINKTDAQQIINKFDRDGNKMLDFNEFLRFLRGDINAAREEWIKKAYNKLDVTLDGVVTVEDIAQIYDASHHPEVIQGKKSEEQIYKEFMQQWDTKQRDGVVTFDEFLEYYRDVSASIDSDEYFAVMMQNAWKF